MDQRERFNDPQESLRAALDGRQAQMWTAMPGIVVSRTGNNVRVTPAIKARMVDVKGNFSDVQLPDLINVPLVMTGGGGFAVTVPVGMGDEVLVVFGSRCIDGWWQLGGVQPQSEIRMHDLSDGFAIPAQMSNPKALSNISSNTLQVRSADGNTYLEIGTGTAAVKASGGLTVTGDLRVTGAITATGEITAMFGGAFVTVSQHIHPSNGSPPTPGH